MKRDNKPTNPEQKIKTRLYDKITHLKKNVPKLGQHQFRLKLLQQEIKEKVGPRGLMLDN